MPGLTQCISQGSLRTERIGSIFQKREREREIYFKQLAHAIVGAVKSKVCKAGGRLETQERIDVVA